VLTCGHKIPLPAAAVARPQVGDNIGAVPSAADKRDRLAPFEFIEWHEPAPTRQCSQSIELSFSPTVCFQKTLSKRLRGVRQNP
jgi:hypothetical protein